MTSTRVLDLVDNDRHDLWQRGLIHRASRGVTPEEVQAISKRQMEMLTTASRGAEPLARYLMANLGIEAGASIAALQEAVPPLRVSLSWEPMRLTAAEMRGLPPHAMQQITGCLNGITRREAAEPAFWTACHAVWIKAGVFPELYDTFLGGTRDDLDSQARNLLRRTGGLRSVRGYVSVMEDCPIAEAWWRTLLAGEAAAVSEGRISQQKAARLLNDTTVWEQLSGVSVKKLTAVNSPHARVAYLIALDEREILAKPGDEKKASCVGALRWLGRHSHSYALEFTPLDKLVQEAIEGIDQPI